MEDDLPSAGSGQARVRVSAADVSFSDVNLRRGRYPGAPRPPFTPGYAMVGVVDEIGPDVTGLTIGQSVAALTFYGSYSQYLCVPAEQLVAMPQGLDPAEAVVLVLSYVSAYQMLHRVARVATRRPDPGPRRGGRRRHGLPRTRPPGRRRGLGHRVQAEA